MCGNACRVFKEAWRKVKGMKGPFWGGAGLTVLIGVAGMLLLAVFLVFGRIVYPSSDVTGDLFSFLKNLMLYPAGLIALLFIYHLGRALCEMFLLLPMRMGIILVVLRHNVEKSISALFVFKLVTWKYIWRFAVLEALVVLMVGIPVGIATALLCYTKLFVMVGFAKVILYAISIAIYLIALYLAVGYTFSYLLVIDRDMTPWAAMQLSYNAISKRWFCVFGAVLWILLAIVIGGLLLLVGLIWAIPYTQNVLVILYRDMMGIEGKDPVTLSESPNHQAKIE